MTDRRPRRSILIAASVADANNWLASQPAPPAIYVVTPRSPHAARGVEADALFATPAVASHARYDALLADALPSIAARRRT